MKPKAEGRPQSGVEDEAGQEEQVSTQERVHQKLVDKMNEGQVFSTMSDDEIIDFANEIKEEETDFNLEKYAALIDELQQRKTIVLANRQKVEQYLNQNHADLIGWTIKVLARENKGLVASNKAHNIKQDAQDIVHDQVASLYRYIEVHANDIHEVAGFVKISLRRKIIDFYRDKTRYPEYPHDSREVQRKIAARAETTGEVPATPEDEVGAKRVYEFILQGGKIGDKEFGMDLAPRAKKVLERNIRIIALDLEGYTAAEVVAKIKEEGLGFEQYDLSDPADLKKADHAVQKTIQRMYNEYIPRALGESTQAERKLSKAAFEANNKVNTILGKIASLLRVSVRNVSNENIDELARIKHELRILQKRLGTMKSEELNRTNLSKKGREISKELENIKESTEEAEANIEEMLE